MSKSKTSNKNSGMVSQGLLVILSAPSGCGKTTLVDRLLKRHPDWVRSISVTTRAPRAGEKDGEDYRFVSVQEFRKLEVEGKLLESAKVFENFYGTPKEAVLNKVGEGKKVILAIDVQGTKKVKKVFHGKMGLCTVFVLPPSVKVLRERLEGRKTESPDQIQHRIEVAQDEIKEAAIYDYTVVNQNLEQTVLEIENFIEHHEKERRSS